MLSRLHIRLESLIVLVVLSAAMAMLSPVFLSVNNLFNIILATATFGVLAIGATFVISSAGLDLSLGSVLGLSSVVGAALVVTLEWPWYFAILGSLFAETMAGAVRIHCHKRTGSSVLCHPGDAWNCQGSCPDYFRW